MAAKNKSKQTRIIAVINQKGGVGKTTTVVNIGAGLSSMNYKMLLVDLDPQAHLTYSLGIAADELELTIYDLLKGEAAFKKVLIQKERLHLIPSSIDLSAAEIEFSTEVGREALLKNTLKETSGYDIILLDCPPNLGLLTLNALTVAGEVFVPLQAEFLSIKGLNKLLEMVNKVKQRVNPQLEMTGLIATLYDRRLKLHNEVFENLEEHFGEKLFRTFIRRNVALAEASSFGQTIFEYSPKSHGAEDYKALSQEIVNRG
ncbi:AAA family ATPase [Candidatus Saccharibacteria bacterium]|nr:AAA family ATPase [Calditrichia bacterium]NIV72097.1 AAA family ATPase [Calditrichia bacterium]NIV98993.1 AAA family ATPase [Candidatus Saccharibacteria bacterium]NIW79248.1 AAA family ATPase [Calditrichia bacterium]